MILPIGSGINMAAVIAGGLVGIVLGNFIPDRVRDMLFQALGLCILAMGVQMSMQSQKPLLLIGSLLLGGLVGELCRLDVCFANGGERVKQYLRSSNPQFTEGFVTASLIFCIGSLAILGPFQEVLEGERTLLYTKSMLDGCAAIALGSRYGSGVLFAGVTVLVYQSFFTFFASALQDLLSPQLQCELNAVGGLLVLGVGITMLKLGVINLANLLPALVVVVCLGLLVV